LKSAIAQIGVPDDKIHVIPNGVDTQKFRPERRSDCRKKLGIPTNKRVLLSVGGLVALKGMDLLIRSVKTLEGRNNSGSAYLVIVGDGEQREALENLARELGLADSVRFAGNIPHDGLRYWYSAADVFCLASSREGWPNVVLESLACGVPVVATNVGGIPEIIRSQTVGIVTERSVNAITDGISQALHRTWDAGMIAEFARQHTWDNVAKSVLGVFRSVLPSHSPNS
jgi:glycosyltransferase involved in cell wall biosynthesis